MARTKVFVGNLSFATKENELTKEFEQAGKVISVNIITRGPRSLGYGFVEMDNEADAENAVKLLNKKEIDGRPINVEVAKPREEGAQGEQQTGAPNAARGGRGGRGGRGTRGTGRGGPRGGDRGERGGRGGERSSRGGEGLRFKRRTDEENNGEAAPTGEQRPRGGFRGGRGTRGGRGGARREERSTEDRTPSTTTLFVANLPFALEDDGFGKVLKDGSLAYKTAHVVKKKSGRSKGFGFVEFDNEGDQQKALNALNNKQIEGRELVVKVALTENRQPSSDQTAQPATAPTTTTTTTPAETKQ